MRFKSLLILILVAFNATAQEQGELNFEDTTYDFGEINYGSEAKAVFKFSNTSNHLVTIKRVSSTCGCTIPKQPDDPIQPGQTSEITVIYDSTRVGPIRKTVTVYSDAKTPEITLRIVGKVLPKSR